MKICKYCGREFGPRANSDICFECMPSGLTQSQRTSRKRELERKYNPINLKCPSCEGSFNLPYGEVNRKYCFNCMPSGMSKSESNNRMRYLAKIKLVKMFGGGCAICGFNKYMSALEFHHLDENTKEFNLGNRISSCEFSNEFLAEVKKCVLLCSNCHRAYHANEITGFKKFDKLKKI